MEIWYGRRLSKQSNFIARISADVLISSSILALLFLPCSLTHTHTHTHTSQLPLSNFPTVKLDALLQRKMRSLNDTPDVCSTKFIVVVQDVHLNTSCVSVYALYIVQDPGYIALDSGLGLDQSLLGGRPCEILSSSSLSN